MRDKVDKNKSFNAVRKFALYQCKQDSFHGNCDVSVDNFLYNNIYVAVYYQVSYEDFRVEITWEDDNSQPDYKKIGLHGYYSSNFQYFSFNDTTNTLSFKDGDHNISVHPV